MILRPSALFIAAVPPLAFGENSYAILNLPRAGSAEAALCTILLGLLFLSIVCFEIVKNRYERLQTRLISSSRFGQNAGRFSLDNDERALMRSMARHCPDTDMNELFYSQLHYERGVDGEVNALLALPADDDTLAAGEGLFESVRKKLHYGAVDPGVPISSTRNISVGQPVWILGQGRTILGEGAVTRMKELSFSIKLATNSTMRRSMFDSVVRMAFTRRGDGVYGVDAAFAAFDPIAGIITCRHSLALKRNQMRADVRVDADFSLSIRCIASEKGAPKEAKPFIVRTVDISGGGISFITEQELFANDTVMVNASAPRLSLEGLQARVVALSQHYGSPRTLYHGQFIAIDFAKKERIVKFVFERLREMNQR
jgi:hypothetical protein